MTSSTLNSKLKKTVLFVLGVVLLLFFFEGILRLYNLNGRNYEIEMWKYGKLFKRRAANPNLGVEQVPLKRGRLQNTEISINSAGFRDKEYLIPKPKDVYRIIVLGSSITFGWGVSEDKTYVSLVEKYLEERTGKRVELINAAVPNYNTVREIESFFEKCLPFDPDMVILSYFLNDPEIQQVKSGNFFLKNSQTAVLLWSKCQQVSRRMGVKEELSAYYERLYSEDYAGWQQCRQSMRKLMLYSKENNVDVLVAMIPDMHNLQNYPFKNIHEFVRKKASELGFSFLDFYDSLKDVRACEIWAMPGDPHPNAKGHAIMADALYKYLLKKFSGKN
ncbi:MAG: SGNH/GDSL hydrolase family protein [Candidatus Omnitrophota bacterium]